MIYRCERRIRTLAENYVNASSHAPKFEFDGVTFENWYFTVGAGAVGHNWLASSEIDAENLDEAHRLFRSKLLNVVPKIALISQCYTEFLNQPFIIHNPKKEYAYFFNIFDDLPVPLHFDDESLEALTVLDKQLSEEFLSYWNDATNTTGASPKLLLLFSAIEALCKSEGGKLDKAKRLSILGEELDTKFFESGNKGLRHRLVHGEYFQQSDFDKNYVLLIHEKVRAYINNELLGKELITTSVVNPQRHFDDNKLQGAFFVKPTDSKTGLNLRELLEDYDINEHKFSGKFDYVFDVPTKTY